MGNQIRRWKGKEDMEQMTVTELYTLKETIASEIFAGATYPWEVLPKIGAFIVKLGSTIARDGI